MRRWHAFSFALALSASLPGRHAYAQDLSGMVRDELTGAPVRGAVVMTLAANREPVVRRLSSSSGTFRISIAGATLLRVIRIGYLPYERPITDIGAGPVSISLRAAGRMIAPVSVRSNPVCPRRNDQREALSLWSSATDALLAMVVASGDSQHTGLMTQILYNRLMFPDGSGIRRQSTRRVVTGNVLPIRADRDPEEFVETGYVVVRTDGATYYAPDPEILLDSSFAATHCLSMRGSPRGDTTRIGVAFEPPYDRRNIPDIAGVLWLNRNPLSLHSLEFEYRGVPQAMMNVRSGGQLQFETLSDGVPIISSWQVRSPRLAFLRNGRPVPAELYETGGLIADGVLSDGTSWMAPLATVRGRVSNIVTDQPVPDAVVTLDSTDQKVTSDSVGRFLFDQLLPGPYVLRVRDSLSIHPMRVDSTGNLVPDSSAVMQRVTRSATVDLNVRIGFTPFVEAALPWREPVNGCGKPQAQFPEKRFVVVGEVLSSAGQPVPDVAIQLSWADTSRGVVLETAIDARADAFGTFIVCGIPSDRSLGSRVITASGVVHNGTARITRLDPEKRRGMPASMRAVTLRLPGDR
ncbi:MAG TPA: carboxypeptidase-like regulatory domain-containing protein [Gemmatimonadaceae bacterium]